MKLIFRQTWGTYLRTTSEPKAPKVVAIQLLFQKGTVGFFGIYGG